MAESVLDQEKLLQLSLNNAVNKLFAKQISHNDIPNEEFEGTDKYKEMQRRIALEVAKTIYKIQENRDDFTLAERKSFVFFINSLRNSGEFDLGNQDEKILFQDSIQYVKTNRKSSSRHVVSIYLFCLLRLCVRVCTVCSHDRG